MSNHYGPPSVTGRRSIHSREFAADITHYSPIYVGTRFAPGPFSPPPGAVVCFFDMEQQGDDCFCAAVFSQRGEAAHIEASSDSFL